MEETLTFYVYFRKREHVYLWGQISERVFKKHLIVSFNKVLFERARDKHFFGVNFPKLGATVQNKSGKSGRLSGFC